MIKIGSKAPNFSLNDKAGKVHSLNDFAGKYLVLYFYPKDDTTGCTIEACEFQAAKADFSKSKAMVVGVSKDESSSHERFQKKYGLEFILLSDPDHKVIEAYGSWGEKQFMGKKFMGTLRNTFIIGPTGLVAAVFTGVTPKGHAKQVVDALEKLK